MAKIHGETWNVFQHAADNPKWNKHGINQTSTMVALDRLKAHPHGWRGPDNKVHGAIMGPAWVLSAPDGPHVGPMNLAIRGTTTWEIDSQPPPTMC